MLRPALFVVLAAAPTVLYACVGSDTAPAAIPPEGGTTVIVVTQDAGPAAETGTTPITDAGVDADAGAPTRIVFVTHDPHGIAAGGSVETLDGYCNAAGASIDGIHTFRAWVSTSKMGAAFHVELDDDARYVDTSLALIANQGSAIVSSASSSSIALDEAAKSVGKVDVWTGTDVHGHATTDTCGDWSMVGQSGTFGVSSTPFKEPAWTNESTMTCGNPKHLYCFEVP